MSVRRSLAFQGCSPGEEFRGARFARSFRGLFAEPGRIGGWSKRSTFETHSAVRHFAAQPDRENSICSLCDNMTNLVNVQNELLTENLAL